MYDGSALTEAMAAQIGINIGATAYGLALLEIGCDRHLTAIELNSKKRPSSGVG